MGEWIEGSGVGAGVGLGVVGRPVRSIVVGAGEGIDMEKLISKKRREIL